MSTSGFKESKPSSWKGGFLTLGNLRDIVLILIILVVAWKLLNSEINISLESFTFTDFLSVLLAFFAISLSVAFYFKATETSNRFYDNSYKFTKEMSEILGRIESGFGEKLKHIDEGYVGLREKFDKIPFDVKQAKEEEQKEVKHIKKQEEERNKIILDLMEKAKVAGDEKDELLKKLEKSSIELDKSKLELRRLQRRINDESDDISEFVSGGFVSYLAGLIDGRFSLKYADAPARNLSRRFEEMKGDNIFDEYDLQYMEDNGLTNKGRLTLKGVNVFRAAIKRAI